MIPCFLLVPTGRTKRFLRRYEGRPWASSYISCPGFGYHDAKVGLDVVEGPFAITDVLPPEVAADDPRWPTKCEHCDYQFKDADVRQLFAHSIYRREDTGEEMGLQDAPPGAMWWAPWMEQFCKGPDGKCLVVKTPGGDWMVDSRASNCTMPDDDVHKCWVRHGEAPRVTVDKDGSTCGAGAGSIICGTWHGFLRDGSLVVC